jgi:hypothetical protein
MQRLILRLMRIISTRVHGVIDYFLGIVLLYSPWIFNFPGEGIHRTIPVILGSLSIIYSLITNYESGMEKLLPMRAHLRLDLASGIVLASSPWIFGFYDAIYAPHLILGCIGIITAAMSDPIPGSKQRSASKQHAH